MADISAARLNNLQSRLELILGNGSGPSGYGQPLISSQVSNIDGSLISAADINAIYADMVKARVHQVGVEPTEIAELISNLNIIAEDTSFFIGDDGITVVDPDGSKKGIIDYETLMSTIETDKFSAHTSQVTLEPGITGQRTADWNGLIYQEITVNFNNADHRRHFFNTGGNIRFTGNNSGATLPKGLDWNLLLTEVGSVNFTYATTSSTGAGSGSAIGNYQLTSTYQTVFSRIGGGTYTGIYSGVYAGNLYTIKARSLSSSSIQFRIEFNDVVTDPIIDNNVDGRLISTVQHVRANSSAVSVVAPTYTIDTTL
jgi:hypothetical protein